jgi:exopolyphosphatase/guanosine-5'-triphosphate,3'-diphosphate pyrophosphatase
MRNEQTKEKRCVAGSPLAVIDIGAHSIRMEIAQVDEAGGFSTLEALSLPIPIGRDVFTKGKIGSENFVLAVKILKDFSTKIREYGISCFRAVATSAVREAANKHIFLDRIRQECGIEIEVLDSSEEIRIMYLSLKNALGGRLKTVNDALICIIGTGASHICLVQGGLLRKAESFRMGTLRIYEELGQPLSKSSGIIDDIVDSLVDFLSKSFPDKPEYLIAVGATPRALASMNAGAAGEAGSELRVVSREAFNSLNKQITDATPEKLVEKYNFSDITAFGLLPCCEIIENLFRTTQAESLIIPNLDTRDALFEEILRAESVAGDPFAEEIISCADYLGKKFTYDAEHAGAVSRYALEIFDAMQKFHGIGSRGRLLLNVAGILHDVGQFLNNRQHHKHSYYLIKNSQLPGINSDELDVVAAVARYHRRGLPKSSNPEYTQLDAPSRVLVSKLAAILRVADALDRSHNAKFANLKISFDRRKMLIKADSRSLDTNSEVFALKSKSDLFFEVYGIKPELA